MSGSDHLCATRGGKKRALCTAAVHTCCAHSFSAYVKGHSVCEFSSQTESDSMPESLSNASIFASWKCNELYFILIERRDFILNCGASVAFMFVTNWDCSDTSPVFGRVQKLKEQFANLYVVVTLPTKEQNDSFVRSYFRYGMVLGRPMFVLVQDLEMGFEKILKIAHARGVCKRQDAVSKMKAEREGSMQQIDAFLSVVTSIPGIDNHDANTPSELYKSESQRRTHIYGGQIFLDAHKEMFAETCTVIKLKLNQAIGSIEAIAKASKELILENTDLSADKAETISRFLRDPKFYLSPKIF
ncbi:hypothetical protein RHSIM_Rhsim08G0116200 [Rhododendron simsii]|uniref:Uncharacterized protein n=1 Tax=Rhododendron simsii TaxID=118357 RepID=A0A834LE51_RHOSS|nr:hypothetical protein RHSIM_Rhsim08G0116200 [Rhododendron simsii]